MHKLTDKQLGNYKMGHPVKKSKLIEKDGDSIDSINDRKMVLRQDRLQSNEYNCYLEVEKNKYPILDYSSFGVSIYSETKISTIENSNESNFETCKFLLDDNIVSSVNLKYVRMESISTGGYRYAFEVIDSVIPIEKIAIYPEILKSIEKIKLHSNKITEIPHNIVATIFSFKSFLQKLQTEINALDSEYKPNLLSSKQISDFENLVIDSVKNTFLNEIHNFCIKMSSSTKTLDPVKIKNIFEFFRDETKNLIFKSPFMIRSFEKPQGYAGDFETMNLIYRNENLGETLYYKCIERRFLEHAESIAVRNRIEYLLNKLNNIKNKFKKIKVLSVACGSAIEIQRFIEISDQETINKYEFHLLDQDIVALKHAQRQITQISKTLNKKINIEYHRHNIRELLSKKQPFGNDFNLIYSAGLFDYFNDDVARLVSKVLLRLLTADGELIIGNFDIGAPGAFALSIVLDWNLIYRTKSDLYSLFEKSGKIVDIEQEKTGVNLFVIIKNFE